MAQQKSTAKGSSRRRGTTPAVGDEVRVPAETRNEFVGYEHAPSAEGAREPLDGLVVSIREISSGQLLKVAAGDARHYVFDLVRNDTFDPRVSSKRNSQGVIAGRFHDSAVFRELQQALRQHAGKTAATAAVDMLAQPPFSDMLDGWRLVRVHAARVEVKEGAD
jgi:hypothetical protein